jgi:hypothetical protein
VTRIGWVGVVVLAAAFFLAPQAGGQADKKPSAFLPRYGQTVRVVELKAGQQTKVIAASDISRDPEDPDPIPDVRMGLYVFDGHGNCLAWDDFAGGKAARDNAVIFVPPQNGKYTVVVRNFTDAAYPVRLTVD